MSRTHGITATYGAGCRCEPCTEAQRNAYAERRKRLADDPDLAVHGRASTYRNWSCRCDACRKAHSAATRNRRQSDPASYAIELRDSRVRSKALWVLADRHLDEFRSIVADLMQLEESS